VEQHAGVIEVKSKVNEGTTFTIILPRVPLQKESQDKPISSNLFRLSTK